jgi:hypothetical protein
MPEENKLWSLGKGIKRGNKVKKGFRRHMT